MKVFEIQTEGKGIREYVFPFLSFGKFFKRKVHGFVSQTLSAFIRDLILR